MSFDGNLLNRVRYTLWSPFYDLVAGFHRQRRRSLALLDLRLGERLLIVGAGTGLDLPLVPPGVAVLATDLTPAMLARARRHRRPGIELRVMDGQALDLPDASFDAVALHLILAVIPDPVRCLAEATRVLRPGGRLAVFDKFVPDGQQPPLLRRILNLPAHWLATDLNRRFGDILAASGEPLAIEVEEAAGLGGFFRILRLRKADPGSPAGRAAASPR